MKRIFSSGSHAAKKRNDRPVKKASTFTVALVLILVMSLCGTLAFLVTHTDPVINTFTSSKSSIEVLEDFTGTRDAKTEIQVKNTGDVSVYVRVTLVANMIDGNNNVTGAADVPAFILDSNWVEGSDGYYYYKNPLASDDTTPNLLGSQLGMEPGMQIVVLADSIQSSPSEAVTEAWSVTVGTDGTISK